MNRRDFLQFLGVSGVLATLPGCSTTSPFSSSSKLPGLAPSLEDKLLTAEGLNYKILIRYGDAINKTEKFGFNNDFIAFHPLKENHGILWVNHEYVSPTFDARTKANIDREKTEVGGSLLEVKKVDGQWTVINNSPYNRRLDANTKIPFAAGAKVKGAAIATGTMGNCAGGKTPWGTFLTCEENYDMFWGERHRDGKTTESWLGWEKFYPMPPEHYGWVVEIEPLTGKAKKHTSMGRCAHECAAVTKAKNGKIVAYTGDDHADEHFYKFISDSDNSLDKGKLYVASLEKGQWISLDIDDQPILKKTFKTQTDVLIYAREAAKLVGATPLDRPEDIEFDPLTGNVLVTLTNNKKRNNFYGSILKIMEDNNDPGSLTFKHEVFLAGGPTHHFACPDNMVFDPKGNLWFTTDMSGDVIDKGPYKGYGNNGLFVFLRSGPHQGQVIRVASAPIDAEFTGPCFSPDYKTLFLSVQHPGEYSESAEKLTSHWPDGGRPKPAVVMLEGELLDKIVSGNL
ncbi:PhoX family protein [Peredibacter sp. HCB2-198]|uniref:PhoX family protein n=1 Tax=Peredibacter sp. HCB2-198 TaxID=3383025 RepID=UPI0038B59782